MEGMDEIMVMAQGGPPPAPTDVPSADGMLAAPMADMDMQALGEAMVRVDEAAREDDLTSEDMEYLKHLCIQDIEEAEDYIAPIRRERIECYSAYRAKAYGNERPGRSKYVSADIQDTVEWILPNLLKIFVSGDRVISIAGRKAEDDEQAKIMEELVDWQLQVENNAFKLFYEWFKDALIYPNAYVETGWRKIVEPRREEYLDRDAMYALALQDDIEIYNAEPVYEEVFLPEVGVPGDPDYSPATTERVVKGYRNVHYGKVVQEGNVAECFHPSELLIGKGETDLRNASFVARRYKVPFSELKAQERSADNPEGIYINLGKLENVLRGQDEPGYQEQLQERKNQAAEHGLAEVEDEISRHAQQDLGRQMVTVTRCWVRADPKGKGRGDRYVVEIANGSVLIRAEKLPFRHGEVPICELRSSIDPHQHFGISVASELKQLQKLKTAMVRQLIDNISFQNNGFWIIENGVNVDLKALMNPAPRRVVRVGDINKIRRENPGYFGDKVLGILEWLDTQREERTGVTRYTQGLHADTLNKTARGISQIMAASQQRIENIARIFASTGVMDLMRHFIENNQQFIRRKQVRRLLNRTVELDPDKLNFRYDLIVSVGIGTGSRQQQVQDMTLIYQTILGNPVLPQLGIVQPKNIYNVLESWLQALGRRDVSRFISEPAPPQPQPAGTAEGPGGLPPGGGGPGAAPLPPIGANPMAAMEDDMAEG